MRMKKSTYIYIGLVTIIGWYIYNNYIKKSKASLYSTATTFKPEMEPAIIDTVSRDAWLKDLGPTKTAVLANYPY